MSIEDCSCRGINPNCNKCSGRGYYDTDDIDKESFVIASKPKKKDEQNFSDFISDLSSTEIKKLINRIIVLIDKNSLAQKKIIQNIPINTKQIYTFRRKMSSLDTLEKDKEELKIKLKIAVQKAADMNFKIVPNFKQDFSDKITNWSDIEVLKEIHWEYHLELRKLKRNRRKIR